MSDERSAGALLGDLACGPDVVAGLGVLWGKSPERAGGRTNLLVSHLFDAAAVAGVMWDTFLAPATRSLLDRISGGRGRKFFMWLCAVHDCGKATLTFQALNPALAAVVRGSKLTWSDRDLARVGWWPHEHAGAVVLLQSMRAAGWSAEHCDWLWPLVAGHHGFFPGAGILDGRKVRAAQYCGGQIWAEAQRAVVELVTRAVGYADLASVQPVWIPPRAVQLELSGLIIMADWIASDQRCFVGVDDLAKVSMARSQQRARDAWDALMLHGGWGELSVPSGDLIRLRFNKAARPCQTTAIQMAHRMATPGLLIIEAPTGEGKTRAALAAAEVLAARFGADGIFLGMPTQATCDPMFNQVRAWVARVRPGMEREVALLHGKRRFNPEWHRLVEGTDAKPDHRFKSVHEDEGGGQRTEREALAEWLLGRHRGLLTACVVGTIDQLLFAAARVRHVMLRMAGLASKVVILDEVHAVDVYMSQFLHEGLRWLGQARVPVIVLSATLSPEQKRKLIAAYVGGALTEPYYKAEGLPEPAGYPQITAACAENGLAQFACETAKSWRRSQPVEVTVLPEPENEDSTAVAKSLEQALIEGGCALVVRNTVDRAQETYSKLREYFPETELRLLHARLTAQERADRTKRCLDDLSWSPDSPPARPSRLIVVATQLAEQSFDIDCDLLVTDLAPIDLLLQRIGRLHRFEGVPRPAGLVAPRVIVTGFRPSTDNSPPWIVGNSERIYGRYLLLRTAAQVLRAAAGHGWSIPADVPALVARVYGAEPIVPAGWSQDETAACDEWAMKRNERATKAVEFLLSTQGSFSAPTLEGLHRGNTTLVGDEDTDLRVLVRDGEPNIEVVLMHRDGDGYSTVYDVPLGTRGELAKDHLHAVMASTTRLPKRLTDAARKELHPLPGWAEDPWLKHTPALVLDGRPLKGRHVKYDDKLGLVDTPIS